MSLCWCEVLLFLSYCILCSSTAHDLTDFVTVLFRPGSPYAELCGLHGFICAAHVMVE
jgi:hypothetical protein